MNEHCEYSHHDPNQPAGYGPLWLPVSTEPEVGQNDVPVLALHKEGQHRAAFKHKLLLQAGG